jgi:hypothetical protein
MSALLQQVTGTALAVVLVPGTVLSRGIQPVPIEAARPPVTRSVSHAANAVWIPGFWDLKGDPASSTRGGWVYIPGQWITPPIPGARWVPGEWGWYNEWWSWSPGHWELPLARGHGATPSS